MALSNEAIPLHKKTIAIFCAGQSGDCLTISSVLRYRNELWGNCKIVWYIADENRDLLKYQKVELRTFPRGFGYPVMVHEENQKLIDAGKEPVWEDWLPLVDEKNHMNLSLKHNYPSLVDIDYGYFPAPHQIPAIKRHNWDYPNCSRKIFGIPDHYQWHPVLNFSDEEKHKIGVWFPPYYGIYKNPEKREDATKIIAIETFCGSGQSKMDDTMVRRTMDICREILGDCYFIFMSHKYLSGDEKYPDDIEDMGDVFIADIFSVRQCGFIVGCCDLLISVSSGISVAASCWGNNPTPILQFCGSKICSTEALALGKFELVTCDNKSFESAKEEFYTKLIELLNQNK